MTGWMKKKYNKDGTEATRSIREDIGQAIQDAVSRNPEIAGAIAGAALGRFGARTRGAKVVLPVIGAATGAMVGANYRKPEKKKRK